MYIQGLNGMFKTGIISDSGIKNLIKDQYVTSKSNTLYPEQIQPASLDLKSGEIAYRLRASFLPGKQYRIEEALNKSNLVMHRMNLEEGAVLETGGTYLIPLDESLALQKGVSGTANPKSSTGRLDIFTRVITDYCEAFDHVKEGYHGPLYAEVSPRTFSVLIKKNDRLCQLRFRKGNRQIHKTLTLCADLSSNSIIGYRAKRHSSLIEFSHVNGHNPYEYWDILKSDGKKLILDPDEFYILASKEKIEIHENEAAEMIPIAPEIGEFRAHYAGFFDPGFGLAQTHRASEGRKGAKAVLEIRGRDVPFLLQDGQPVAHLSYETLIENPTSLYGNTNSHYQYQGLKLSKVFKKFSNLE